MVDFNDIDNLEELDEFEEDLEGEKHKKHKKKGSKVGRMLIWIFIGLILSLVFSRFIDTSKIKAYLKMKKTTEEQVEEEIKELPLVKVFHVIRTDFKDNLPVIGTVKGIEELDLRFETNGVISEMPFLEGDFVGAGEIIAKLNPKEFKIKVDYQKSNFEAAQSTFLGSSKKMANAEKMYQAGAILLSKLDEAVLEADNAALKMKSAQYELESAEHELVKVEIKAPVSGVIGVRHMNPGEFVTSNEKVITLVDITIVNIELGIIEKDIDKIAIGLSATITVDAYSDMVFEGEISNILPIVEGKSRTLTAKVQVDNDQNLLLPGMFARANIAIFEDKDTIMIPTMALNKGKEGYAVNVVSPQNVIEARSVKVGYITTEHVQIIDGLDIDEFVVVETQEEIKDGDEVQIIEVQESTLV